MRKKIDLDIATEDWMKARFPTPERYEAHIRRFSAFSAEGREAQMDRDRKRALLADELDLYTDMHAPLYMQSGRITIYATGSFDAKGLNRLMNREIVWEGRTYTFANMRADAVMTGDTYMGEYNESATARMEIVYEKEGGL